MLQHRSKVGFARGQGSQRHCRFEFLLLEVQYSANQASGLERSNHRKKLSLLEIHRDLRPRG